MDPLTAAMRNKAPFGAVGVEPTPTGGLPAVPVATEATSDDASKKKSTALGRAGVGGGELGVLIGRDRGELKHRRPFVRALLILIFFFYLFLARCPHRSEGQGQGHQEEAGKEEHGELVWGRICGGCGSDADGVSCLPPVPCPSDRRGRRKRW